MAARIRDLLRLRGLEILLTIAALVLLLQFSASLRAALVRLLGLFDVRRWPGPAWLWLNIAVVFVLCGVRFGPGIVRHFVLRQRQSRIDREAQELSRKQLEEREILKRLQQGRRRRIY